MAMRLAERLQEIHEVGLVHCDLHSSNIVVNTPNDIRIIDLGYTRAAGKRLHLQSPSDNASSFYAPELFDNSPVSFKTDVYSLGYILKEIKSVMLDGSAFDALIN